MAVDIKPIPDDSAQYLGLIGYQMTKNHRYLYYILKGTKLYEKGALFDEKLGVKSSVYCSWPCVYLPSRATASTNQMEFNMNGPA